jgi:hypothetical protein
MKIEITKEDMANGNIELSRTLINEALLNPDESTKIKKLFLAYKTIQNTLKNLGLTAQDLEKL